MKWGNAKTRQFIANLPSEACSIFHAGFGVVTGRSSDLQAWPVKMTGVSTDPSSRFQRKPVVFGCSILLTAAGQSRIRTGFPLTFPWERHQQTSHKIEGCPFLVNPNVAVLLMRSIAPKSVDEVYVRVGRLGNVL